MSTNITPEICGQESVYVPELDSCDECDRLAIEFENARAEAVAAASDAQTYAGQAAQSAADAEAVKSQVQTIASDAVTNITNLASDTESAFNTYITQAREILEQIIGATISRHTQTFTSTANQSEFTFAPTGYTYNVTDYYTVYVNGLKLTPSEFTQNQNVITLATPISLAGQTVEIVVDRATEE